jgi:hypothetical protein
MTADALFIFDAEPIGAGRAGPVTNIRIGGAIAAAVAAAVGVAGAITNSAMPVRALPYVAVGITAAAGAIAVTIKRRHMDVGGTGSVRMTLSADGITLTSPGQTTTIQWAAVRIEERRGDFIFYLPEGQPVRVRKAAISQAQGVERLRSFLMGQVGTRAKLLT